ncbi:MAG: sensor histidine kinase [Anaerolineales bacterium]
MQFRERSIPQQILYYFLSVLIIGITTAVFYPWREGMGPAIMAMLYLIPIMINAAFWGLGEGIVSAVLAFLTLNFYFSPPYGSFFVHRSQDLVILFIFLGVAIVISQLVGRMRDSLRAATSREREAIQLYDLMVELAGLQDEQSILDVLTRQTRQALDASYTAALIMLSDSDKSKPRRLKSINPPIEIDESALGRADFVAPIQMSGKFIGELRIWRANKNFTQAQLRLIRIYINQAVLAIERASLSRAMTYAKILEESNRLKSSLLSSVSHELRTPLATIKAAISSLRSNTVEWDSNARADLLALVEEETDHLNLLVGNLLNMSRIESGALTLERSWNSIGDIIQGALKRSAIYAAQHQLTSKITPDLPYVYVDYLLLEQVLINLINNSVKYAPKGSEIHILADKYDGQNLWIRVTNEGPPIPQEYLERIFEKFFQIEKSGGGQLKDTPIPQAGTGLGLSISKGIIEAHGGRIWAENLPNGLAFNFTIPIQPIQQSSQAVMLEEHS